MKEEFKYAKYFCNPLDRIQKLLREGWEFWHFWMPINAGDEYCEIGCVGMVRYKNFADEAVRNCNKTSGNGDKQATRKPDLDSAAVNERKRNE